MADRLAATPDQGILLAGRSDPWPGGIFSRGGVGSVLARRLLPAAIAVPFLLGWLEVCGLRAGLYDASVGTALFALCNVAALVAVIVWNALWLERLDIRRTAAEEAVGRSERRYRALVQAAPQVIWSTDAQGMGQEMLTWWHQLTGQTAAESSGWGWVNALHPDDRERTRAAWHRSLQDQTPYDTEYRVITPRGECRHVAVRGVPVFDERGEFQEWVGTLVDVTQKRRAEEALRESESRQRQLTESLPQLVWTCLPTGECDYLSPQWCNYTGVPEAEQLGYGWSAAIHPDDKDRLLESWQASVQSGAFFDIEFRIRSASGAYRWFKTRAVPIRDASGQVVKWFGSNTDIEDRKQVEEQLREMNASLEQRVVERTAAAELRAVALMASEQALRAQKGIMESILNSIGEGTIVADEHGGFLVFNPAAERLLGMGKTADAAQRWSETYGLFTPDGSAMYPPEQFPLTRAIRGEPTDDIEILVRNPHVPSGTLLSVTGRPLVSDEGVVKGGVVVFRDVTARRQAEQEMRAAKEAAEAANRAKSEFLANMSHEVRTPMNGILGMTELALDTNLNPEQREYLGAVKQSAEALLQVIDDILDFSKIEAGKLVLDPDVFRLRDGLADMLKPLAVRAHEKGLELACHVKPDVPDAVIGDLGRLRQVVTNLVGNAIKFTQKGEVTVRVQVAPRSGARTPLRPGVAENGRAEGCVDLHVSVVDTGIGIPEDKLATIFAPFEQADSSTTRRFGGTGLGLTISARLVELMDGRIWVESTPGCGSTFHFTARLGVRPTSRLSHRGLHLRGLPVLVADDNATSRAILHEMIAGWGMSPTVVATGQEVLSEFQRADRADTPYRIVVLDATLVASRQGAATASANEARQAPSGGSLAARLQQVSSAKVDTILLLSSPDRRECPGAWQGRGITACITKPVKPSELLATIERALRDQATARSAYHAQARPDTPGPDAPLPGLHILLAEDNPVNQHLALKLLEKQGHRVVLAANGKEALNALARQRFDLILMDVQMPEMDGLAATARIRQTERGTGRHVPIIALTAHAMKGDREHFLAAGMDGHVTKPLRPEELGQAIVGCLAAQPASAPVPSVPAREPGLGSLLDRLDGDTELLEAVLDLFTQDCDRQMSELCEAVGQKDLQRAGRLAHALRGGLLNLGAGAAASAALTLEELSRRDEPHALEAAWAVFDQEITRLREGIAELKQGVVSARQRPAEQA